MGKVVKAMKRAERMQEIQDNRMGIQLDARVQVTSGHSKQQPCTAPAWTHPHPHPRDDAGDS